MSCEPIREINYDLISDMYVRYWERLQVPESDYTPQSDEVRDWNQFKLNWMTYKYGLPKQYRDNCWADQDDIARAPVSEPDGNDYDFS